MGGPVYWGKTTTHTQKVLKEPVTLYRVYGSGRALGQFWSRNKPNENLQNALDSVILDQFQNSQANIVKIRVPEKRIIYEGDAARQITEVTSRMNVGDPYIRKDFTGGGNQVYIDFVDPSWVVN
jgi:hypothetical protein